MSNLDECGRLGFSIFSKEGAVQWRLADGASSTNIEAVGAIIQKIWRNELSDAEQGKNEILKILNHNI